MSSSSSAPSLVRRPARALPVILVAVVLLALGATGIWILGTRLLQDSWPPAAVDVIDRIARARVDDLGVQITAVVVVALGLALVMAALIPGTPSRMYILHDDVPGETAMARRDVAQRICRQVENADGVHSADVKVTPKRIHVGVHTVVDDPAQVRATAVAGAEAAVADLRPLSAPTVRVRTHRR